MSCDNNALKEKLVQKRTDAGIIIDFRKSTYNKKRLLYVPVEHGDARARKSDVQKTLKVDSFSNNDRVVPEQTREIRRAVTFFVPDYRDRKHTYGAIRKRRRGVKTSQKVMSIFATILLGQTNVSGPCTLFVQTARPWAHD